MIGKSENEKRRTTSPTPGTLGSRNKSNKKNLKPRNEAFYSHYNYMSDTEGIESVLAQFARLYISEMAQPLT